MRKKAVALAVAVILILITFIITSNLNAVTDLSGFGASVVGVKIAERFENSDFSQLKDINWSDIDPSGFVHIGQTIDYPIYIINNGTLPVTVNCSVIWSPGVTGQFYLWYNSSYPSPIPVGAQIPADVRMTVTSSSLTTFCYTIAVIARPA